MKAFQGLPDQSFVSFSPSFPLQATDLARSEESLRSSLAKVYESKEHLEDEQERLPVLKKQYRELEKKVESMESLSKIEEEIKRLKVQLVWAHHEANKAQVSHPPHASSHSPTLLH